MTTPASSDAAVSTVEVRPARPGEAALIHGFIVELAAYERLSHEVVATAADVDAALFGRAPRAFCDVAEIEGAVVGFALWFYTYSTFVGRHGLYLEDLYVRPEHRGASAGRALLAGLAQRCAAEGLGRLEWAVLDWNTPAIGFYDRLGAASNAGWTVRRLEGRALAELAAQPDE